MINGHEEPSLFSRFLKNYFQPVMVSVGSVLVIAVSVFILVTLPAFRAKMDFVVSNMEDIKEDIKEYKKGTDKTLLEALIKQGELETRINDLEKKIDYENNNQKLKP